MSWLIRSPGGRWALVGALATALWWPVATTAAGEDADAAAPDDHEIKLAESTRARVGEASALSLTIATRAGFIISADGPVIVELKPIVDEGQKSGLQLDRRRYRREHAADPRAESPRFDLRYRATEAGGHRLAIQVGFWVCNATACRPVTSVREVRIDAE